MKHLHPHAERIAYLEKEIHNEEVYLSDLETSRVIISHSIQNPKTRFADLAGLAKEGNQVMNKITYTKKHIDRLKKELALLQNSNG